MWCIFIKIFKWTEESNHQPKITTQEKPMSTFGENLFLYKYRWRMSWERPWRKDKKRERVIKGNKLNLLEFNGNKKL